MRVKAYREALAEANVENRIASQIRLLRESAGMTQGELAAKLGTGQGAVARLENVTYGKHSIAMLHRVAKVFDVATWVEFVPFSTLLRRTADLSPEALTPKRYDQEFGENGELSVDADVAFDRSAICQSHYIERMEGTAPLFISTSGSSVSAFSSPNNLEVIK